MTYELATERGYDILPVEDASGSIVSTVATRTLDQATSWEAVLAQQELLTPERLVAREAPVLRLLDRLEQHEILFTLGRTGVDGVVTIYDLNQPAAHLLGFGMALICESDVTRELRATLGEDPDAAYQRAHDALGKTSRRLAAWKHDRSAGRELHVAAALMFGEKLAILRKRGFASLAAVHGLTEDALIDELEEIAALRNAIGHYDEQDDRLADPQWTFKRMKVARRYAERVPGDRP
jgi:hypothetical protein